MAYRISILSVSAPLWSVLVSALCSLAIAASSRWHGRFSADLPNAGIQKLHTTPTPRIGGVAILLGILMYLLSRPVAGYPYASSAQISGFDIVIFLLPVFLIGLLEDLTRAVRPAVRLIVAALSVIWMSMSVDILILETDVSVLDALLKSKWIAIAFTAFALSGFSHAFNLIDGLNGLASSTGLILLAAISIIADGVNNFFVFELAIAGMCALAGFALLNFPRGWLFMGDGGAYFTGLWLAICATLLVMAPDVSACQMIAVCAYPVIETVYSMWRRFMHRRAIAKPDRLHLHSMLYRRVCLPYARRHGLAPWHAHTLSSALLALLNLCFAASAILLGVTPENGLWVFLTEIVIYLLLYRRLIYFKWF